MYQEDAQQEETSMPGAAAPGKYPVNYIFYGAGARINKHWKWRTNLKWEIMFGTFLSPEFCWQTFIVAMVAYFYLIVIAKFFDIYVMAAYYMAGWYTVWLKYVGTDAGTVNCR